MKRYMLQHNVTSTSWFVYDRYMMQLTECCGPDPQRAASASVRQLNTCPSCGNPSNHRCRTGTCFHCDGCGEVIP